MFPPTPQMMREPQVTRKEMICGKAVASLPIFSSIFSQSLFFVSNLLEERFSPVKDLTLNMQRLSNFLLYQCAYAELFFVDTLWPDFSVEQYNSLVEEYACRTRNFGGLIDAK